ncbi:MAG: glutamate-5-semialdehyde dehydrogenase [Myxococcales bacterium]
MSGPEVALAALELATRAKAAARGLAATQSGARTRALEVLARELEGPAVAAAMASANEADVAGARAAGLAAALLDRLRLDPARLAGLSRAVREIAAQPDPVGERVEKTVRPNGLSVERVRAPLGTVLMIYEARPNVTSDAAALCLRAGNSVLLRGGREALQSNSVLVEAARRALAAAGLPEDAVQLVPPDRALLDALLQLDGQIDLCIPRGGPSLIEMIRTRSRIPVIQHYQGVCHLYVAADADLAMAERIAVNAKAQRPGVCNALECLLVDAAVAADALPRLARALAQAGVELRCDARALPLVRGAVAQAQPAGPQDFGREFLDLTIAVAVVDGVGGALAHIARYGSRHSEGIVTRSAELADRFVREVDASCALVNASTRFNDGGELGLGAEIGISTSKLHAYGPMGARELTCTRFVVRGDGQVRT